MKRIVNSAKTQDGKRVRVGDYVKPVSGFDGSELGVCKIEELWQQGANGVIARFDRAPDADYPNHHSHRVSRCLSVN